MQKTFVAYYRVSTAQQGRSGLGLDAQRSAVNGYLASVGGQIVKEFVEIETGKGANALSRRPELNAALAACSAGNATLLIAKLDRLARNVAFIAGLIESGADFIAVDMPSANKTMLQIHSVMAEWERDQISARTKAALAEARSRGVKLGAAGRENLRPNIEARQLAADALAERLRPMIEALRARESSQRQVVTQLNAVGIQAPRGGAWSLAQLQRVLRRLQAIDARAKIAA